MVESALLDVRVLPWRPRARVLKAAHLRDFVDPALGVDDIHGLVIGFVIWILILIFAPLIVLVLAGLVFSVELPIIILLAVVLLVVRFTGILPWTVVILDAVTGEQRTETYRSLFRALRRIRDVNSDRRVQVRWAWA